MSGLPKNEIVVDGLTVRTVAFNVWRALPAWLRVSAILAPAFEAVERLDAKSWTDLVGAFQNGGDVDFAQVVPVLPAFAPFLRSLSPDAVTALARELLTSTVVMVPTPDGKTRKIDLSGDPAKIVAAFGSNLTTLLKVLWFVAKVNFSANFQAARGGAGDDQAADDLST